MQSVVGVFGNQTVAQQAIDILGSRGVDRDSLTFASMQSLTGAESADRELQEIPTTDAESDGMGTSVGAVVGGSIGASAGLAGGAAAGAAAGKEAEHALDIGVPKDDLRLYHDLLRRGRSLVIANVESDDQAAIVREVLRAQGAEDIDAARGELGRTA